jgi:hypothetical protein
MKAKAIYDYKNRFGSLLLDYGTNLRILAAILLNQQKFEFLHNITGKSYNKWLMVGRTRLTPPTGYEPLAEKRALSRKGLSYKSGMGIEPYIAVMQATRSFIHIVNCQ